jgi:hypothetical protein
MQTTNLVGVYKKWQVTYIAPLQPYILAVFLPWGGSTGAGRIRLAGAKIGSTKQLSKGNFRYVQQFTSVLNAKAYKLWK